MLNVIKTISICSLCTYTSVSLPWKVLLRVADVVVGSWQVLMVCTLLCVTGVRQTDVDTSFSSQSGRHGT